MEKDSTKVAVIGIDIAKRVFSICCASKSGRVIMRKTLRRAEVHGFMREMEPCKVGMEACAGAHYWAREFQKMGHEVKLMAPAYVKPFVKTNKNDNNDAEGCCEAVQRPTMRFVEIKSEHQQEMMQVHRIRERLIKATTALSNEIRGFLAEFGVVIPKGINKLAQHVNEVLSQGGGIIPPLCERNIKRMLKELSGLREELKHYDNEVKIMYQDSPESQRIGTIPGIGMISATALVATATNVQGFKNGRQFGAYLGLVPRQHTTGGKPRLGGISKRGDVYLRKLLIQGAHAVLRYCKKRNDNTSVWLQKLSSKKGVCQSAVALANKNARIVWALLARGGTYTENHQPRHKKQQLATCNG